MRHPTRKEVCNAKLPLTLWNIDMYGVESKRVILAIRDGEVCTIEYWGRGYNVPACISTDTLTTVVGRYFTKKVLSNPTWLDKLFNKFKGK